MGDTFQDGIRYQRVRASLLTDVSSEPPHTPMLSSSPLPSCSVIVRCYNEERHIGRLLAGILRQTVGDVEIIVVDSGSTDGTLDVASRYPIRIIEIDREEFSFGRSLNRGCVAARREVLVVASAHVYPRYDDWLERLLEPFADRDVALVYGKQRGAASSHYSERQLFRTWFPDRSELNQVHPFCNNANAAIRRAVWERLRYDEALTGLEDVAWARAAQQQGHRVAYEARAEVVHVHDETAMQIFNRYEREAIAMKAIYPHSQFGFGTFLRLSTSNITADLRHAATEGVLLRHGLGILAFRFLQFWGTYRGYRHRGPVSQQLQARFYYPSSSRRPESLVSRHDAMRLDYDELGTEAARVEQ